MRTREKEPDGGTGRMESRVKGRVEGRETGMRDRKQTAERKWRRRTGSIWHNEGIRGKKEIKG